jgi:hypothetical protein
MSHVMSHLHVRLCLMVVTLVVVRCRHTYLRDSSYSRSSAYVLALSLTSA